MPGGDALIMLSIRFWGSLSDMMSHTSGDIRTQEAGSALVNCLMPGGWGTSDRVQSLVSEMMSGGDTGDTSSWPRTPAVACAENMARQETDCGREVTKWPLLAGVWSDSGDPGGPGSGLTRDAVLGRAGPASRSAEPQAEPGVGRGRGRGLRRPCRARLGPVSCERPGGRDPWCVEQWPVSAVTWRQWPSDSDYSDPGEGGDQAVTRPLLSLTTLARRAEWERETSSDQMTSDNISRVVWIITWCWPRYTDSENQSREINKTARPPGKSVTGKIELKSETLRKTFLVSWNRAVSWWSLFVSSRPPAAGKFNNPSR